MEELQRACWGSLPHAPQGAGRVQARARRQAGAVWRAGGRGVCTLFAGFEPERERGLLALRAAQRRAERVDAQIGRQAVRVAHAGAGVLALVLAGVAAAAGRAAAVVVLAAAVIVAVREAHRAKLARAWRRNVQELNLRS